MEHTLFEDIKSRASYLKGVYIEKKKNHEDLTETVSSLEKESEVLEKTEKVLKHLVDKLVKKDLKKMDELVTYGLNTVFPDRNLKFESTVEELRGKLNISLRTIYNGEAVDPSSMSSISVIESFLLRVLCIIKLKKAPFLLMDETFAAVDSDYIENVSRLIAQISEKLKIDILAVTHNPKLSESAKACFRVNSIDNSLEIERVK